MKPVRAMDLTVPSTTVRYVTQLRSHRYRIPRDRGLVLLTWSSRARYASSRRMPWEQPLQALTYMAVAFTSRLFETGLIGDRDCSSMLSDEAGRLERARDHGDGGALNAQHYCE